MNGNKKNRMVAIVAVFLPAMLLLGAQTSQAEPPSISTEPRSRTVTAPATAMFSVTATGTPPLSYHWKKNGAVIGGATSSTYTTPATTTGANGASFTVTVTNNFGSITSSAAILTVNPAPTMNSSPVGPVLIGGQPQDQEVIAPGRATFSATAIGTAPITYQWNKNGAPISGATSATYTTPPTTSADNGASFTVTVRNTVNGFASVPATLTVASATVAPTIAAQPQNTQVSQGNIASFYVFATGTAPLAYRWYKNRSPIAGATDPSYTTTPTTSADNNAQFTVTVTNGAGSVTSPAGTLFVNSAVVGLTGFRLLGAGYPLPFAPSDVIGVQYNFQVITNEDTTGKLIFGFNYLTAPGSIVGSYDVESNIYSYLTTFANGACTTYPPVGTYSYGQASLGNATADYPYEAGHTSAVGSAIHTSDPVNWPVQTYLVDNTPHFWKSDSMSQFSMNGLEGFVTVQRAGTLTDVSGFERCGLAMLSTTYRMWTITTHVSGHATVVNQVVVPDSYARYIVPAQAMQFASEFLAQTGTLTVQYWNFAYMRESNPVWSPASTFMTNPIYDGAGHDFGVHVVSVSGQDRVEFSNVPGNSYLPGNLPFSIATVITTNPATNIASFSATLNGSLDPDGLTTSVHFQYGTTSSYGSTTAVQSKTGNTYQNVAANISGLTASTTYHFRIVATNSAGTRFGSDRTFTTLSPTGSPVVTTNPATFIAGFSAMLNSALDPHGLITTIHFQYGTTTSYGLTTAAQSQTGNTFRTVSANISGLSASHIYHFRIVATNSAGTGYGGDRTFTTLSATGAPVVTTSPATNVASSSATLNGSLDPHGLTTTVHFQYGRTTSYGSTTPMRSQTGSTFRNVSANISGLSAHTTYHFRIIATNSAGDRVGSDKTFTTP